MKRENAQPFWVFEDVYGKAIGAIELKLDGHTDMTDRDDEFRKVMAILPDCSSGAPCGACRELMVQLMPESYKDIEIMMDYKAERIMTLGELTLEWWI